MSGSSENARANTAAAATICESASLTTPFATGEDLPLIISTERLAAQSSTARRRSARSGVPKLASARRRSNPRDLDHAVDATGRAHGNKAVTIRSRSAIEPALDLLAVCCVRLRRGGSPGRARMLRKCLIGALIAVLQAVALPGAAANAALWSRLRTPRSFKAGFIWQEGSGPPQRGELYFSHGRIRKQIQSPSGGRETIEIVRPDEKKIFQIDSGKHVFYVLPWNSRAALLSEALRRSEKRKLVGSEIIQGRDCDKYEGPRGPGALPYYFWVTKGSDLPVQLIT